MYAFLVDFVLGVVLKFGHRGASAFIDVVKIKGTLLYLELVRDVRLLGLSLLTSFLFLIMFAIGLLVIPVCLIFLSGMTESQQFWSVLGYGLLYLLVPIIGIRRNLSEKRWMKITGASSLVDTVLKDD